MGFYIRKAFNFGPFRLNLSKKGIGTSVGVKGLRVSTGPRGTELYAGRYGMYYRQKLGSAPEVRDGDVPPVQTVSSDSDIPPMQVTTGSRLGISIAVALLAFALFVIALRLL